jgi:hypothetical protein
MSIVGKFFFHCGKEYSQTGEIIAAVSPELLLVRLDKCDHVPPHGMAIIELADMVASMKEGYPEADWEFFDSREHLAEFMTWLETPSESNDDDAPRAAKLN